MHAARTRPLKIAIAPDAFKGTMTADEAARQIEKGVLRGLPGSVCTRIPMADGGEGTVAAIVSNTQGRLVRRKVSDPLGRPIMATFGISGDGDTAVIEMAAASGLTLLAEAERDPMVTSTFGTGELMRHALDAGVSNIVMGIGGSATVDAGAGMAQALGVRLLDARGRDLAWGGRALVRLARIDMSGLDARIKTVAIKGACDVTNPLTGARGAACVYGPQKGASAADVKRLAASLQQVSKIVASDLGLKVASQRGAGAAGGLGAGLLAFLAARLCSGVDLVMDAMGFAERIKGSDLVVTGEGRMDAQTPCGKTPAGVAAAARAQNIPVVALVGSLATGFGAVHRIGIDAVIPAAGFANADKPASNARRELRDCAEQFARTLQVGRQL